MQIAYKAGLLTAALGRGIGKITGNVLANFTRGVKDGAMPIANELNYKVEDTQISSEQQQPSTEPVYSHVEDNKGTA